MNKRLTTLEEFKMLQVGDKVSLITKKNKTLHGSVEVELTNRGYIDLNEITIYVDEVDYGITINVDKYISNEGSLKDFIA